MTRDELADELRRYRALVATYGDGVVPSVVAAIQLADERDRAQALANAWGDRSQADEQALKVALGQRDRALELLRDERRGAGCAYVNEPSAKCGGDWGDDDDVKVSEICWEHRRRALLAEVDG